MYIPGKDAFSFNKISSQFPLGEFIVCREIQVWKCLAEKKDWYWICFNVQCRFLNVLHLLFHFLIFPILKKNEIGSILILTVCFFIFQSNTSILCEFVLNSSAKQFKMFNFRFNIAFVTNIGFKSSTYSPRHSNLIWETSLKIQKYKICDKERTIP